MSAVPHPAPPATALPAVPVSWRTRLRWVPVLLVVLLGLAGCSAGDSSTAGDAVAEPAAPGQAQPDDAAGDDAQAEAPGEARDEAEGQAGAGPEEGSVGGAPVGSGSGRRVVTAGIDVAVEDVPAAAADVRALAVAAGGDVYGERSVGGERPRAEIVVRVPVDATGDLLGEVAALGNEVSRTAETEPAENRLVDLESRTATQRAGVERIRSLLEQASSLEDVLALEAELTRRQADLESVDAQRAALADRAALATVTVVLTLPSEVEVDLAEPLPPFLQGLDAGWQALVGSTTVVLVVLGALLPFLVVAGVVAVAVVLVVRAVRGGRRQRGPGPAEAGRPGGTSPSVAPDRGE